MPAYVVLSPLDAGTAQVVRIDGRCYSRNPLPTSEAPTHSASSIQGRFDACQDCPTAPSSCPSCGLAAFYQIESLAGLQACDNCNPSTGIDWNGKFGSGPISSSFCRWPLYAGDSGGALTGKLVAVGLSWLELNMAASQWEILIRCRDPDLPQLVWFGVKLSGNTPAGVYKQTGGCSPGPAQLRLI